MSEKVKMDQWVWVVVQDPGGDEKFLGQQDQERGVSFIPAFLEREEAEQGLGSLHKEAGHKYEIQAIQVDDLRQRASESGFVLFFLNAKGEVLEKMESGN